MELYIKKKDREPTDDIVCIDMEVFPSSKSENSKEDESWIETEGLLEDRDTSSRVSKYIKAKAHLTEPSKNEDASEKCWRILCNVLLWGIAAIGLFVALTVAIGFSPSFYNFLVNHASIPCEEILLPCGLAVISFLPTVLPFFVFFAVNNETKDEDDYFRELAFKLISVLSVYIASSTLLVSILQIAVMSIKAQF